MNFTSLRFIGIFGVIVIIGIAWFAFINWGKLTVILEPPFVIEAENFRWFECRKKKCTVSVPGGQRNFCIRADGFFPVCENLYIPMRWEIPWQVFLKKIPSIIDVKESDRRDEQEKSEESELKKLFSSWKNVTTPTGKFFAFQKETGNLLFFEDVEKSSVVAHFQTDKIPELFALGEKILVLLGDEVLLVDPEARQKFRLFSGKNIEVKALKDFFLLRNEQSVLFFAAPDFSQRDFPVAPDFSQIVFCDPFLFAFDEKKFLKISPQSLGVETIAQAEEMTQEFRLACGKNRGALEMIFADGTRKGLEF